MASNPNIASYYEWHFLKDGKKREVQYFEDYERKDGQWRGTNPVGEKEHFNESGGKIIAD